MAKQIQPEFLYRKFLQGECTPEELANLFHYFGAADEAALRGLIGSELQTFEEATATEAEEQKLAHLKELIDARIRPVVRTYRLWPRIAAAASILFILLLGGYFLLHKVKPVVKVAKVYDIAPGKNKATLTLANGQKIVLSAAVKGELAVEAGVSVNKTAEGELVYSVNTGAVEAGKFNTLATARGEQYQVVLPDGTHVWLDAETSLKYPASFKGNMQRRVELNGEAYFEVAKDKAHPFIVMTATQEVEVLGTHFNVNAYGDEPAVRTTLLEGSVKVTDRSKQVLLKPGQMAINDLAESLKVKQADIEEVMGWKNGLFVFNDENIRDVLKIVARWYDIEVEYKGNITQKRIWGTVSRYKTITELLDNMTITSGIHYKIEGRRVILMN